MSTRRVAGLLPQFGKDQILIHWWEKEVVFFPAACVYACACMQAFIYLFMHFP